MNAEAFLFASAMLLGVGATWLVRRRLQGRALRWAVIPLAGALVVYATLTILYRIEGGPISGSTHVNDFGEAAQQFGTDMKGLFLGGLRGITGALVAVCLFGLSAVVTDMALSRRQDLGPK